MLLHRRCGRRTNWLKIHPLADLRSLAQHTNDQTKVNTAFFLPQHPHSPQTSIMMLKSHLGDRNVNLPHPQVEVSGGNEAVVAAVQPLDAESGVLGRRGAAYRPPCIRLPDDHGVVVLAAEGRKVLPVEAVSREHACVRKCGAMAVAPMKMGRVFDRSS